ncbi:LacI family DNA-binding transcriptional regulator [Agrococcus sp. BE272]|uniref:LacI family DNA-binding transcriptional regulator n=1 Tax=Agrococcus sp. BE272 TaxID=2817727 RepID=UPI00285E880B|nr:LacI family DNA-binding transcriptional regulator [Agrococcus sp. BE272]MDR7235020.1 LacI family transcriptional regulator [Agrococcus sp. BE272]
MSLEAAEPLPRKRRGRATIYDIAQRAGVNPSTVSRALTRPGRVSEETEARIMQAAKELGYRANPAARALPTGRTRTLALLVADITNPVVFDIIRGAERSAAAGGYTLVIAESQESGTEESSVLDRLLPAVDGFVLAMSRLDDEAIREVASTSPVVLVNRRVDCVESLVPAFEAGIAELVAHLADLGHRRIAYLDGPAQSWTSARRWEAIRDAAAERGIEAVEIGPGEPTLDGGAAQLGAVLESEATAAVAYNDVMAIGLLRAATAAGIAVPGRLSVAGFDDIFGADFTTPQLTTVKAPLTELGEQAVRALQAIVADEEPERHEPLPSTLIVRGSTGAPAR